jgi:DNA-binding transcriptional LysR family regulator
VTVHVEAANRYFDLIDNNIDVAIRTREYEPDSNVTIRRLGETRRILAASPRYFAQHGFPKTLDDLKQHKLLIYTHANNPNELRFTRKGETHAVSVTGLLESNDGQVLRAAALDGMGILVQPTYIVYDDIVAGRLVPTLDDWDLPHLAINLAYPSRKHLSAKVRSFIDFMAAHFAGWTTSASGRRFHFAHFVSFATPWGQHLRPGEAGSAVFHEKRTTPANA